MRYYRFRRKASKKVRTVLLRILFVLAAAAVITGVAILTGNLLLRKVNAAEDAMNAHVSPSGNAVERTSDDSANTQTQTDVPLVRASGLSLTQNTTEEEIKNRMLAMIGTYDTVSVTITDRANHADLLYASPALIELFRMPENTTIDPLYTRLKSIANTAGHSDLRCSAVMASSLSQMDADTAALVDGTLAGELYQMGFQEILLIDVLGDDADTDTLNTLRRYLNTIQNTLGETAEPFQIGVCLPTSVYLSTTNAKQLQMLANTADFLAMDAAELPTTGPSGTTLTGICTSLSGSFQLYSLRVLLTTEDLTLLATQYQALTDMGITNLHFTAEITPEMLVIGQNDADTDGTIPADETALPTTNPYVTTTTTDDESDETSIQETEPETEPTYRTDAGSWY